ncbi:MAG: hypothetical protein MUD14_08215 [Hydrococcus sp. Prado102]|jgi:hypothetical protein|nr:hypothetical protein [Hydrococcus sp. Prado102]
MSETQPIHKARRGRIFPENQWTKEQIAKKEAEREAFYQRCKPIFERVKPKYLETHYNWYMTVEPESEDYFIDKDEMTAIQMSRQKHPNAPVFIFRINETGRAGTI